MTGPVLTEVTDGVGVLTLNRPAAKNAVDVATTEALAAAVDEFEARDDVAVLVLTGAGGTFCAGMDLKAFARGERPRIEGRGFAGQTADRRGRGLGAGRGLRTRAHRRPGRGRPRRPLRHPGGQARAVRRRR